MYYPFSCVLYEPPKVGWSHFAFLRMRNIHHNNSSNNKIETVAVCAVQKIWNEVRQKARTIFTMEVQVLPLAHHVICPTNISLTLTNQRNWTHIQTDHNKKCSMNRDRSNKQASRWPSNIHSDSRLHYDISFFVCRYPLWMGSDTRKKNVYALSNLQWDGYCAT